MSASVYLFLFILCLNVQHRKDNLEVSRSDIFQDPLQKKERGDVFVV